MKTVYKHAVRLITQHKFYYDNKVMFVNIFKNSYGMKPKYCGMIEYVNYPREYVKYSWSIGYIDTDGMDLFEQRCMANEVGPDCLFNTICHSSNAAGVNMSDINAVEQYAMDVYNSETANLDKSTLRFSEVA